MDHLLKQKQEAVSNQSERLDGLSIGDEYREWIAEMMVEEREREREKGKRKREHIHVD